MSTKDVPTTKGQAALAMREISTSVSASVKVISAPSVHLNISSQTMSTTQAFRNGRIFTAAAGSDELVDLLVISDGLVEYAGPSSSYTALTKRSEEEVDELLAKSRDLEQAVVLPGFIDSHTHLEMMGDFIGRLNLLHCEDLADLKRALVDYRNANPGLKRLLGRSWMWEIFARGDQPTRQVIDDVISDIPVYLDANDLHSCWLNSKALEELGIDETVTNPKGGEFARDREGHLTGFLSETAVTE
jgi:predicted amidohydrolase YtcJ